MKQPKGIGFWPLCILCGIVNFVLQSRLFSAPSSTKEAFDNKTLIIIPENHYLPFEWCTGPPEANSNVVPNALALSYENLRTVPTGLLGDLRNNLTCVCGCQETSTSTEHTTVYCSFDNRGDTVRWCVFHNPLFFASDWQQNPKTKEANRRPLLVAVCEEQSKYRGLLSHHALNNNKWWKGYQNFGANDFSHVKLHRIAPFSDTHNCQGSSCRIPKAFVSDGTRDYPQTNGWKPETDNRSQWVDWNGIGMAPQSRTPVTYWDSSDCSISFNSKQDPGINPWHCKAVWVNYLLLSGLLERFPQRLLDRPVFDRNAVQLFSLAGAYHFFDYGSNMSGWYEMMNGAARGGGFDTSFRSGSDPVVRSTVVELQGRLDLVIPNLIPASSLMWDYVLVKQGESSSGMRSEVMDDMRNKMKDGLVPDLLEHPIHPIRRLIGDFSEHVHLVLPKDVVKQHVALKALELDYGRWDANKITWEPQVLDRFALVLRRHSLGTIDPSKCKRCLTNVEEVAHSLAESLGLAVIMIHPTLALPEQLQDYLFLAAQTVVGMHGGAWGSAWMLTLQQGAVEVTPKLTGANARHLVTAGGGVYDSSLCLDCGTSKSLSGRANISDIVQKTKAVLCRVASFSDV